MNARDKWGVSFDLGRGLIVGYELLLKFLPLGIGEPALVQVVILVLNYHP